MVADRSHMMDSQVEFHSCLALRICGHTVGSVHFLELERRIDSHRAVRKSKSDWSRTWWRQWTGGVVIEPRGPSWCPSPMAAPIITSGKRCLSLQAPRRGWILPELLRLLVLRYIPFAGGSAVTAVQSARTPSTGRTCGSTTP